MDNNKVLTKQSQGQCLLPILEHTIWCKVIRIVVWSRNMRASVQESPCEEKNHHSDSQGQYTGLSIVFSPRGAKNKHLWVQRGDVILLFLSHSSPPFGLHQTKPGDTNRNRERRRQKRRQRAAPLQWLITSSFITDSRQVTYQINKYSYYKELKI